MKTHRLLPPRSFLLACGAVLALSCAGTGTSAAATLLLNGSFESPLLSPGTGIAGGGDNWTPSSRNSVIASNGFDDIGSTPYGSQFLGLNAGNADSQTVPNLVAGTTYYLTAYFADAFGGGSPSLTMAVTGAATASQTYGAPVGGPYGAANTIPFTAATLSFVAQTSGAATVTLTDSSPGAAIVVDNVLLDTVAPVPEPSTWALVGLGGAGLLGFGLRRRVRLV